MIEHVQVRLVVCLLRSYLTIDMFLAPHVLGCFEKSELVGLLLGKVKTGAAAAPVEEKFLRSMLGAGSGLGAAFEIDVRSLLLSRLLEMAWAPHSLLFVTVI